MMTKVVNLMQGQKDSDEMAKDIFVDTGSVFYVSIVFALFINKCSELIKKDLTYFSIKKFIDDF